MLTSEPVPAGSTKGKGGKMVVGAPNRDLGVCSYYQGKIDEMELVVRDRTQNLERLKAQRNELNAKVRLLREELHHLQESGSFVGEVVKAMGKKKVRSMPLAPSCGVLWLEERALAGVQQPVVPMSTLPTR